MRALQTICRHCRQYACVAGNVHALQTTCVQCRLCTCVDYVRALQTKCVQCRPYVCTANHMCTAYHVHALQTMCMQCRSCARADYVRALQTMCVIFIESDNLHELCTKCALNTMRALFVHFPSVAWGLEFSQRLPLCVRGD